jgi:hypothetical protein
MIERCRRLDVDTGDVASLLALELVAPLAAYNRAPLAVILAATREALCARPTGAATAAAAERRQTDLDRSRRLQAALEAVRLGAPAERAFGPPRERSPNA